MYSLLPPRYRRRVQWAMVAGWVTVGAVGIAAIAAPPASLLEELGPVFTAIWGGILALGAALAATGVARSQYRLEWVASWVAAAGITPYTMVLWWLALTDTPTSLSHAFLATAALMGCVKRIQSCAAHAARLRELHAEVTGG